MSNYQMVVNVLNDYGAMTSSQIAVQVNKHYGVVLSASQVAGVMRPLIVKGEAATSKDEHNKTRYWMVSQEWR